MTKEGAIVHSRYDKYRQINRFLEFIEDILPQLNKNKENVIIVLAAVSPILPLPCIII